jgi:uncharacterized protein YbjT (DUF2867 family)
MRVVVVGAGGFIGSRIVVELLSRDHSVVCAGRAPEKLLRRFPACEAVDVNLSADIVAVGRGKSAHKPATSADL